MFLGRITHQKGCGEPTAWKLEHCLQSNPDQQQQQPQPTLRHASRTHTSATSAALLTASPSAAADLIALAARDILKGNRHVQLVMAGPIGDEYGEQARALLEKVAQDFPGRVVNAAGQYVAGPEKEQLILATGWCWLWCCL